MLTNILDYKCLSAFFYSLPYNGEITILFTVLFLSDKSNCKHTE